MSFIKKVFSCHFYRTMEIRLIVKVEDAEVLLIDNQHPHTRDFSRELGCWLVLKIKEFF